MRKICLQFVHSVSCYQRWQKIAHETRAVFSCKQIILHHDDIIKWKHFPRYWPFMRGIHRSLVKRPVTRSFDVFLDLRPNKRLSKQSWSWWFEMASRSFMTSLWRNDSDLFAWMDTDQKLFKNHIKITSIWSMHISHRTNCWTQRNVI